MQFLPPGDLPDPRIEPESRSAIEFEQAPGDGEEQRSLAFGSPWDGKELGTTKQLNNDKVAHRELVFYNQLLLNLLRLQFRKRRCLKIQERY